MIRALRMVAVTGALVVLLVPLPPAMAGETDGDARQLRVIQPEETTPYLDPAFEMIMEKVDADLKFVLSSPVRLTPRATALTGLTVLTTFYLLDKDEEYTADAVQSREDGRDEVLERLRVFGRHLPETAAGLYLIGYVLDRKGLKSRSLQSFESIAVTALIAAGSGLIIGHKGPSDSTEADQFEPFGRYHSLPDMTSSLAFSVCSVFAYERPFLEAALYYGIAAGTAYSRVYFEDAWSSDVFLGSVIGTAIGRTIAGRSNRDGGGSNLTLVPVLEHHGQAALGLKVEWKL